MTSVRRRTFRVISGGLCGQFNVNAAYLCGFGEAKDQEPPNHRRWGKFVVCPMPPGKIDVLEIDDRLDQPNDQLALLLLFTFLHRGRRVAQKGGGTTEVGAGEGRQLNVERGSPRQYKYREGDSAQSSSEVL